MPSHSCRPRLLSIALALAFACLPAFSPAQTLPAQHTYYTTLTRFVGSAFPSAGSLRLSFARDGSIVGAYTPQDSITFSPVVGQVNGPKIWLDINGSGHIRINGTIHADGSIHGAAIRDGGDATYVFLAMPAH